MLVNGCSSHGQFIAYTAKVRFTFLEAINNNSQSSPLTPVNTPPGSHTSLLSHASAPRTSQACPGPPSLSFPQLASGLLAAARPFGLLHRQVAPGLLAAILPPSLSCLQLASGLLAFTQPSGLSRLQLALGLHHASQYVPHPASRGPSACPLFR